MASPRHLASTAVALLLLAAAAAAQDRTNAQGTNDSQNPYNPVPQGPGTTPFGLGTPAGTQFSRDPKVGGGAAPTDRNGTQTTVEPGTGSRQLEQSTPPSPDAEKKADTPSAPAVPAKKAQTPPANAPQTKKEQEEAPDADLPAVPAPARKKDLIKDENPPAATPAEEVEPDSPVAPQ